ncbi:uncharacterized protein LOC132203287 [Neocloeon triangulifer]|uniref:uncharacterized protein LOC132203287 n=1 Tax=Neocloeon triangulifer TaxID=2078957 RepID=UPI00286F5E1D|nr:uncharacterized protein LOC132203287 [Neocloeon triangulifer]
MGEQAINNQADPINWKRTGDIVQDQLYLYEHGYFYDCTFAIGAENKIFKCHKVVLARASNVFATMLNEYFEDKQAKSRDDPIAVFTDTSAKAFDFSMRFIHGNEGTLESIQVAIEVYRFAHACRLDLLLQVAADFMAKCGPKDAISVYECFKTYEDDRLDYVMSVISKETSAVFLSVSWRQVSVQMVKEIFKFENLSVPEERILYALIVWLRFQNIENRKHFRNLLKLIRFRNFEISAFCSLIQRSKNSLFTDKEKLQILMNLGNGNKCPMPDGFTDVLRFRNLSPDQKISFCQFTSDEDCIELFENSSCLSFEVDFDGLYLTGVQLHSLSHANKGQVMDLSCTVTSSATSLKTLTHVQFQGENKFESKDTLSFPEHVILKRNVRYTLYIMYQNKEACKSRRYRHRKRFRLVVMGHSLLFTLSENFHDDISALIVRARKPIS